MSRPDRNDLLIAETYATIRDHVLPSEAELRWRDIPWRASLHEGLADAQAAHKPLLLWAMDGHPLGSTCSNGIVGRLELWTDEAVRQLAAEFVPAADDAGPLARGTSPDSELFRAIAEQGHYAGRSVPTSSRQGVYATTPTGRVLASRAATDPRAIEEVLATALERWRTLDAGPSPDAEGSAAARTRTVPPSRGAARADAGLVLRVFSRDLPRDDARDVGPDGQLWNQDHVWCTAAEALGFVPNGSSDRCMVPRALMRRIARLHLVDNVRGQTVAFAESAIEDAVLWSEVVARHDTVVTVRLDGHARACQRGTWPIHGFEDVAHPSAQERGYDMRLLGHAEVDVAHGGFRSFELVAAGMRWGATQYNRRDDDPGPTPMGVVFVLAGEGTAVPPALR